jgi:hypothetical protein
MGSRRNQQGGKRLRLKPLPGGPQQKFPLEFPGERRLASSLGRKLSVIGVANRHSGCWCLSGSQARLTSVVPRVIDSRPLIGREFFNL